MHANSSHGPAHYHNHNHSHARGPSRRPREPLPPAAAALFDSGNELAEAGDLPAALEAFEHAVRLDPGCALLHEAVAQLHNELGASEQALAAAVQAVQLAPTWPAGHLTLAAAARNCGLLEPAAAALRTALLLLPAKQRRGQARAQAQALAGAQAQARAQAQAHGEGEGHVRGQCGDAATSVEGLGCEEGANAGEHGAWSEELQEQREEAARELQEVLLLLERQLAHDVGLPALRIAQQSGLEPGFDGGLGQDQGSDEELGLEAESVVATCPIRSGHEGQQGHSDASAEADEESLEEGQQDRRQHRRPLAQVGIGPGQREAQGRANPASEQGGSGTRQAGEGDRGQDQGGASAGRPATEGGQGPSVKVWEAGVVLARLLVEDGGLRRRLQDGCTVLELGAGAGVVGLAAALMGGRVALTDLPRALPALRRNIDHNSAMIAAAGGRVEVAPLDWRDGDAVAVDVAAAALQRLITPLPWPGNQLPACEPTHTAQHQGMADQGGVAVASGATTGAAQSMSVASLQDGIGHTMEGDGVRGQQQVTPPTSTHRLTGVDKQASNEGLCSADGWHPTFDFILGSDLVYASHQAQPVAAIFAALAAAHPGATLLLAHKHRSHAVDSALAKALDAAGLRATLCLAGPRVRLEQAGLDCLHRWNHEADVAICCGEAGRESAEGQVAETATSQVQAYACLCVGQAVVEDSAAGQEGCQRMQEGAVALAEPCPSPLTPSPPLDGDAAGAAKGGNGLASGVQLLLDRYPTVCVFELRLVA